ncbi:MAG: Chromate resistance protein ChrB, partial [Acidimicrobiales bacterium]
MTITPTRTPPVWPARTGPARPDEPLAPDGRWPRWTRLTIDRSPSAKKDQVALWRELRRQGALKLDAGTWAVGHAPDGSMPLDRAIELLDATGGRASWAEADGADEDRALRQACRRVWTDLHVEVDQLEEDAALGELDPAAAWDEADRLRLAYADG